MHTRAAALSDLGVALALRIDYRLDAAGLSVETTATNVGAVECRTGRAPIPI